MVESAAAPGTVVVVFRCDDAQVASDKGVGLQDIRTHGSLVVVDDQERTYKPG